MNKVEQNKLTKYLSPLGVWALSFGCAVGWGAFVMPGTTFLPIAGPVGTVIGLAVGAIIMMVIGRNYYYLMNRYPDAGGTYSYTKLVLGHDHGFLSAWFLVLTYIVIVWANLTALALIGRNLLGNMFMFGFHYQLAGYDIYFGEILATIGVLFICCFICMLSKRLSAWVQILMAVILIGGIIVCFVAAAVRNGGGMASYQPAFSGMSKSNPVMQIVGIIALAPWAYVGFESVSHSTEEFKFKTKKSFIIIIIALITSGLAYILLSLLAVKALPEGYANWVEYISDLGNVEGVEALPTFYAVRKALGDVGIVLLGVTTLGGIITGIIGNTAAASRVLYSLAKDEVVPKWFGRTNEDGNPFNAILFIAACSAIIPFFGRTAISWIVDVTTVGGTIIYCYTSAAALKEARAEKDRKMTAFAIAGVIFSVAFALYFLIPNISSVSTLGTESYLILTVWSILGLVFFLSVFGKDKKGRYGKSIVVWLVLLFLIMFTSVVWMQQANGQAISGAEQDINGRYGMVTEQDKLSAANSDNSEYVDAQMKRLNQSLTVNNFIRIVLITIAVLIIFAVYRLMFKRQTELERMQDLAYKDAMTSVGNSHAYQQTVKNLDKEIEGGVVSGFAVAVCDINGLKIVNDSQGHAAGDKLICEACRMICDVFAHSPVYRIGGDEFTVILRGRDYDSRSELVDSIRENSRKNIENGGIVVAVGISEYDPKTDRKFNVIFYRADTEMYKDKKELKELENKDDE